ncbi:MAG: phenylalanine--tRNA ligase subunit beta [Planctomycetota bacterium]
MRWSMEWLSDFVDLDGLDPEALGESITLHTAEVDEVIDPGAAWDGIVVGFVEAVRPHPDADKLRLVTVQTGSGTNEVVCGAPNVAAQQKICYAPEGVVLPGGLKLEKRKIRGVESNGMVLSERELGLSEEHEGILVLDTEAEAGTPVRAVLPGAPVIDVDNTAITTRPDLWGHYGAARELAAILDRPLQPLDEGDALPDDAPQVEVVVETPDLCPRYLGWVIDGIEVGPSPDWLVRRLDAAGQRSINNVVDLTNYIQLELGQPLHAFDVRQIRDGKIVVRAATANEKVTTLDGTARSLPEGACVIADPERAVAIAGVMGLENSEVVDDTTSIILEVANFAFTSIRKTSGALGLRTDSATRFEKGVDVEGVPAAARRFFHLLKQLCPDAKPRGGACDVRAPAEGARVVELDEGWIGKRLGLDIPHVEIDAILSRLGFDVERNRGKVVVAVPSWRRRDIAIPEDIVEEVGRIHGYDKIAPEPLEGVLEPVPVEEGRGAKALARQVLSGACGLSEVHTYPVYSEEEARKAAIEPTWLAIANWEERGHQIMASSLVPLVLRAVDHNLRYRTSFGVYLIAPTWEKEQGGEGLPEERTRLAIALAAHKGGAPIYRLKGMLEELLTAFEANGVKLRQQTKAPAWLHAGRSGDLGRGNQRFGWFGELHPAVKRALDLDGDVAIAEIDLEALQKARGKGARMQAISRFPVVPYDVAVVVDARTPAEDVERTLRSADKKLVRDVQLFDVYEGKNLPEGKRSLAFRMVFGAMDRTLSGDDVDRLRTNVESAMAKKNWDIRK